MQEVNIGERIMDNIIYIVSISLQVAGALLLMFFSISTKRENIIRAYFGKGSSKRKDNSNEIEYSEKTFKDIYKTAYLTKFSFAYIALGYLLSIYGESSEVNRNCITILIIGCTILCILLAFGIVAMIMKYSKIVNKKVTYDELSKLDLEVDIVISSEETLMDMINMQKVD